MLPAAMRIGSSPPSAHPSPPAASYDFLHFWYDCAVPRLDAGFQSGCCCSTSAAAVFLCENGRGDRAVKAQQSDSFRREAEAGGAKNRLVAELANRIGTLGSRDGGHRRQSR